MIRRLLATALCLGVVASLGTPVPAQAAPPVQTVDVPSAPGPNAYGLIAVADGQYLFADGSIYDSEGHIDVVDEVVGATLAEFTGDEVVLTRGVSGAFEVVLVDLVEGTVTVADVPYGVRAAGVEGWVIERVFYAWDGTSWPLPDIDGIVTQQAGGHLIFGAYNTLAVIDIVTREVRELGPKGNSQQISDAGLGWRSPTQHCYWSWDETDPTCVSDSSGATGVRPGRDITVSWKRVEYPPSRLTDHKVWRNDKWIPAPAPEGVRVTACGVPSVDAVCVGSSATGRSVYIIEADGTWTTAVALPGEPVEVFDLALTPDALYGADSRGRATTTPGAWRRPVTNGVVGPEKRLDADGEVDASAGRALIGLQWFDGVTPGPGRLPQFGLERTKMSGSHVLLRPDGILFDVMGRNLIAGNRSIPVDIFGTAQLYGTYLMDVGGQDYGLLYGSDEGHTLETVWGPWVSSYVRNGGGGGYVTNRITRTTSRVDTVLHGRVWGLGDGIAVTHQPAQGIVKVFDTTTQGGLLAPKFTFEGTPRSIDRNRLAWTTADGDIRISTFPFGGRTAPMMLGLTDDPVGRSTFKPWTPSYDFSSPLAQGQIVVKDVKGVVVHTIDTPASPSGSLRPTWNTRDKAGKALPNGGYTWELVVKDHQGQQATRVNHLAAVTGVLTVGPPVSVTTVAPRWEVPCGKDAATTVIPKVLGILYRASTSDNTSWRVTAEARPGFVLSGATEWVLSAPTKAICTAPAPTFVDKPGTVNDRLVIPSASGHLSHYSVNGSSYPAGTHAVGARGTVLVRAHFQDASIAPIEWSHTFSTAGAPAVTPKDPYSTTGEFLINGRKWRTTCTPYSSTVDRCRTEIWATQTTQVKGSYVSTNGWVFNNLTYLASPRATWKGNPLADTTAWTAADGRKWRTECDTALTGKNGCRTFLEVRVIEATAKAGGGYTYAWQTRWVFNNMVRFS